MHTLLSPRIVAVAVAAAAMIVAAPARAASADSSEGAGGPTIVLVHGAWEQASSWSAVAERLRARGYRVLAPEIPLRTLAGDAAIVAGIVHDVDGPVVLAGHSYGGAVISNSAGSNVAALVYVAAFAPDAGESIVGLDSRVPGSLVAASLVPVPFAGPESGIDLYINPLLYPPVFAADLPAQAAANMAATQRPLTLTALTDPAAEPAWKTIASWYLVARDDLAIPPDVERFMARRAKATTVEIASSHAAPVSHPDAVTDLILDAARTAAPPTPATVTGLRVSPSAFRTARSARVSYSLDVAASVRFGVQRAAGGRRVGGRCTAPAKSNRAQPACTRLLALRGGFTRTRPAGADRFRFTGRISGRTLTPGSYRLVATPTGGRPAARTLHARVALAALTPAAGPRSHAFASCADTGSRPAVARFRVVR